MSTYMVRACLLDGVSNRMPWWNTLYQGLQVSLESVQEWFFMIGFRNDYSKSFMFNLHSYNERMFKNFIWKILEI